MSTTGPAIALTLNAIEQISNPVGAWSTPPASVQLQNDSPFTLEVVAAGLQSTIPSFTAQTIDLAQDGTASEL